MILSNVYKIEGAHLQSVNNHNAKFKYLRIEIHILSWHWMM